MPTPARQHHRAAAALMLLTVASAVGAATLLDRLLASLPSAAEANVLRVDRWVELVVTAAGAAASIWLALSGGLALMYVAAARVGRTWRAGEVALRRAAPGMVHRLARVAVGVSVGAGLALVPATAHAAADDAPVAPEDAVTAFDLGWQPTDSAVAVDVPGVPAVTGPSARVDAVAASEAATKDAPPPVTAQTPRAPEPLHRDPAGGHVVVHRGDTLWEIAATRLPDRASDADVLRAVAKWHEANRDVIGEDPDVILPGQVLRAPA